MILTDLDQSTVHQLILLSSYLKWSKWNSSRQKHIIIFTVCMFNLFNIRVGERCCVSKRQKKWVAVNQPANGDMVMKTGDGRETEEKIALEWKVAIIRIFVYKYEEQQKGKHKALSHLVSNRFVNDELATTPIPHKLKFVRVFCCCSWALLFIGPSSLVVAVVVVVV